MTILNGYLVGWRWPLGTILVSAAMLAAAHGFERFAYLAPCPLCLRQREIYWALIAMSVVGLILWRLRATAQFLEGLNVLIALVFLTGAGIAGYHMGAEYGWWPAPSGCGVPAASDAAAAARDSNLIDGLDRRLATASCTEIPWQFLGLSMAGWNMLISLGFAGISFHAARVTARP